MPAGHFLTHQIDLVVQMIWMNPGYNLQHSVLGLVWGRAGLGFTRSKIITGNFKLNMLHLQ